MAERTPATILREIQQLKTADIPQDLKEHFKTKLSNELRAIQEQEQKQGKLDLAPGPGKPGTGKTAA